MQIYSIFDLNCEMTTTSQFTTTECQFKSFLVGLNIFNSCICSASLDWFAYMPEWYEAKDKCFAQSEAQSVSIFVHHLMNDSAPAIDSPTKERGNEKESNNKVKKMKLTFFPFLQNCTFGVLCYYSTFRLG